MVLQLQQNVRPYMGVRPSVMITNYYHDITIETLVAFFQASEGKI